MLSFRNAILMILIACTPSNAQKLSVDLTIRNFDYKSGRPIPDGYVEVTLAPPSERAASQQNYYRYRKLINEAKSLSTITIGISPPDKYDGRTLSLRRLPLETLKLNREVRVFLFDKDANIDYDSLAAGTKSLDLGEVEKALSLFEYAYRKADIGSPTQYVIKLKYNYARSLLEACKTKGYDTCQIADRLCADLGSLYAAHARKFEEERITQLMLKQCRVVIGQVASNEKTETVLAAWREVESSLGAKKYDAAASQLEQIIDGFDSDSKLWISNGKPKWALHSDAADAYIKTADANRDETENTKRIELLERSKDHLEKAIALGDNSDKTRQNLTFVGNRLSAFAKRP